MSQSQDWFSPSEDFKKDHRWWERVAPHLNYSAMMIPKKIGTTKTIEMDASTSWGIGAVNHITKELFMLSTPKVIANLPIHCGEMSAVMLVVDAWTGQRLDPQSPGSGLCLFQSTTVTLLSDNQSVITAINSGKAKEKYVQG